MDAARDTGGFPSPSGYPHTVIRAGDVEHSLADITLAREVIGFEPHVMFEDGLARAIEWYKANL